MAIPILDQGAWCRILLAFSEVSASASDNSRSVFCLAAADDGVLVVGSPFHVGLSLVPLLWQPGHSDLDSRVNHSVGRRCGTHRTRVVG